MKIFLEGRIDSKNAGELELRLAKALVKNTDVEFDAENLDYISSAGLRVLLKMRKKTGRSVSILNVSNEVYDIFSVTGFTELFDVHKKMREVSVEGCEILGEGANGKVYRLTSDEIIKVFRHGIPLETIETEREAGRKAFLLGVPCAIAFDTVKCGDSYGTIYEMFDAGTLSERIKADGKRLPELAVSSALLLRKLHAIEIPEGQMQKASDALHRTINALTEDFTPDEIAKMHGLFEAIPEKNRFVHNDYHTKNIMESKGELMLIDLGDAGAGNPAIDLIHCYMVYRTIADLMKNNTDELLKNAKSNPKDENPDDRLNIFFGLTVRQMNEFWKIFINAYCGSDQEKIKSLETRIAPYANFLHLTVSLAHPLLPKEFRQNYIERMRSEIFPRFDELTKFTWEIPA